VIVRVLGSGSKGNSILVEAGDTRVLIDAGFSVRGMSKRLEVFGIPPASIEAAVVTHEHIDHVGRVAVCAERWGWRILASEGTRTGCESLADAKVETLSASGTTVTVGQLELTTIGVSHDANEPMAVIATSVSTGARVGIVYDLGVFTQKLARALTYLDILMIEANHDDEMLRCGPYPLSLQRRIASRYGHLSNFESAAAASECAHKGMNHLILAHLSQKNNTPWIATETVRASVARTAFRGTITPASQGQTTGPFVPKGSSYRPARQLELGL
jgi:phosphoribosyl 1,2-cyclic phosphodiesterase